MRGVCRSGARVSSKIEFLLIFLFLEKTLSLVEKILKERTVLYKESLHSKQILETEEDIFIGRFLVKFLQSRYKRHNFKKVTPEPVFSSYSTILVSLASI